MTDKLGYDVFETERGLEIQIDDDTSGAFKYGDDGDAIKACIADTLGGNVQSAAMLTRVLLQE